MLQLEPPGSAEDGTLGSTVTDLASEERALLLVESPPKVTHEEAD